MHEFEYDSYWPPKVGQYGNYIEISTNCILTTISNLLYMYIYTGLLKRRKINSLSWQWRTAQNNMRFTWSVSAVAGCSISQPLGHCYPWSVHRPPALVVTVDPITNTTDTKHSQTIRRMRTQGGVMWIGQYSV